jgi:hypothetical protein
MVMTEEESYSVDTEEELANVAQKMSTDNLLPHYCSQLAT